MVAFFHKYCSLDSRMRTQPAVHEDEVVEELGEVVRLGHSLPWS